LTDAHHLPSDRDAGKLAIPHGDEERDQAWAAHLVALLDHVGMFAIARASELAQYARKGGGRRSGRGILRHPKRGREHPGVEGMTRLDGLAAEYERRPGRFDRIPVAQIRATSADLGEAADGHEGDRDPRRPARGDEIFASDIHPREAQRRGKPLRGSHSAKLGWRARNLEARVGVFIVDGFDRTVHRSHALLEEELARLRAAVKASQQGGGPTVG